MGRFVETSIIIDRRLYKDKDGNIVEATDPNRAELFATPGKRITVAEAQSLGLMPAEESEPEEKPAKKARQPEENKAITPGDVENK